MCLNTSQFPIQAVIGQIYYLLHPNEEDHHSHHVLTKRSSSSHDLVLPACVFSSARLLLAKLLAALGVADLVGKHCSLNRVIMIDQNMIGVFKTSKGMIMTIKMTLPYS